MVYFWVPNEMGCIKEKIEFCDWRSFRIIDGDEKDLKDADRSKLGALKSEPITVV